MLVRAVVITCAALVWQGVASSPRDDGLIVGRVVDGYSSAGIAGAVVTWSRSGTRAATGSVLADRSGQFALTGVPTEGSLSLRAAKPGYIGGRYHQQNPDGPFAPFEFDPGVSQQTVTLRLWTSAAIAGNVVAEAGDALVRVQVVALQREGGVATGAFSIAKTTTTDDQGNYRLAGLTPDSYVVAVVSGTDTAHKSSSGYPTTFFPDTVTLADALPVTVRSGAVAVGVNFRLTVRPSGSVAGIVVGPDGNPVSAEVRVTPAESADMPYGLETADLLSGDDGRFAIDGIPLGRYVVRAVKGALPRGGQGTIGGLTVFNRGPLPDASSATLLWGETTIEVSDRPGAIPDVQLQMRPGVRISGRVIFEGAGQAPSANDFVATPILILPAASLDGSAIRASRIEADATFATAELIPGRYVLNFIPLANHVDAFQDWSVASMKCDGVNVYARAIAVTAASAPKCVVRFGYRYKPAEVVGEIRDGQAPTSDAVVYAIPTDRSLWPDLSSFRRIAPGRAGTYRLPLVPGTYFVAAVRGTSPGEPGFYDWLASVGTRVSVTESQSLAQNLVVAIRGSR